MLCAEMNSKPYTTAEGVYERYLASSHKSQSLQQRPQVITRRVRSHRTPLLLLLALVSRSIRTCDITFLVLMQRHPFRMAGSSYFCFAAWSTAHSRSETSGPWSSARESTSPRLALPSDRRKYLQGCRSRSNPAWS